MIVFWFRAIDFFLTFLFPPQYFGESNVEAMLATLLPLHEMMERAGPTTLKEVAFVQVRGEEWGGKRGAARFFVDPPSFLTHPSSPSPPGLRPRAGGSARVVPKVSPVAKGGGAAPGAKKREREREG